MEQVLGDKFTEALMECVPAVETLARKAFSELKNVRKKSLFHVKIMTNQHPYDLWKSPPKVALRTLFEAVSQL